MKAGRCVGLTLLDLVIALALLGILVAIALPAYEESARRSRRSDATAALLLAAARQEQHMLDRGTYSADMVTLGYGADPAVSPQGHYEVEAAPCMAGNIATCYRLIARPLARSPQAADSDCTRFSLDSRGHRSAQGAQTHLCW